MKMLTELPIADVVLPSKDTYLPAYERYGLACLLVDLESTDDKPTPTIRDVITGYFEKSRTLKVDMTPEGKEIYGHPTFEAIVLGEVAGRSILSRNGLAEDKNYLSGHVLAKNVFDMRPMYEYLTDPEFLTDLKSPMALFSPACTASQGRESDSKQDPGFLLCSIAAMLTPHKLYSSKSKKPKGFSKYFFLPDLSLDETVSFVRILKRYSGAVGAEMSSVLPKGRERVSPRIVNSNIRSSKPYEMQFYYFLAKARDEYYDAGIDILDALSRSKRVFVVCPEDGAKFASIKMDSVVCDFINGNPYTTEPALESLGEWADKGSESEKGIIGRFMSSPSPLTLEHILSHVWVYDRKGEKSIRSINVQMFKLFNHINNQKMERETHDVLVAVGKALRASAASVAEQRLRQDSATGNDPNDFYKKYNNRIKQLMAEIGKPRQTIKDLLGRVAVEHYRITKRSLEMPLESDHELMTVELSHETRNSIYLGLLLYKKKSGGNGNGEEKEKEEERKNIPFEPSELEDELDGQPEFPNNLT